ncbi:MAG: hypothetical protein ACRDH6_09795 [Actinomycetota bacterium]
MASVVEFDRLARAGGIGLMTTRVALDAEPAGTAPYVTMGAGAAAGGPAVIVPAAPRGSSGAQIDTSVFKDRAEGAEPGSLGEAVDGAGLEVAVATGSLSSPVLLLGMDEQGRVPRLGPVREAAGELLEADLLVVDLTDPVKRGDLPAAAALVATVVRSSSAERLLVIVAAPAPTPGMLEAGDRVTPLILAEGSPSALVAGAASAPGLTSDTTRRDGVVTNVDVAPTILAFLGLQRPSSMTGSVIRVDGENPTELHERYLDQRGLRVSIQVGVLGATLALLVAGLVLLFIWRTAPPWVFRAAAAFGLASLSAVALLVPASFLPELNYAFVLPLVVGGAAATTAAALAIGRGDPARTVAVVAALWIAVVVADGFAGWRSTLTPLLGSGALDGGRFYGMTNTYGGVALGGSVLFASRLRPGFGTALLLAMALFVGLLGVNFGAGVTMFAATGLFIGMRRRGRLGLVEIGATTALVVAGVALMALVHGLILPETHIGGLLDRAEGSGYGEIASVAARRFLITVETTSDVPAAWLVVATLPIWLVVAWRRLGPFGAYLDEDPGWQDGLVVLALASIVGYLANDSGIAMAGMAFAMLLLGLFYPALHQRWQSR